MRERRRSIRKPVYIEDLPRHIMYKSSSVKFNADATTKRFDVICCWAGKEGKERKESLRFKNSTFTSAFIETSNGERMNEWTHRRMNGQMARTSEIAIYNLQSSFTNTALLGHRESHKYFLPLDYGGKAIAYMTTPSQCSPCR